MKFAFDRLSLSTRFALISLAGLIAAAALMTWIFERHNTALLRTTAEHQNTAMTRTLGNFIYPAYKDFFLQAVFTSRKSSQNDSSSRPKRSASDEAPVGRSQWLVEIPAPTAAQSHGPTRRRLTAGA